MGWVSREHAFGFSEKEAVESLKARILLSCESRCFLVCNGKLFVCVNSTKYPVYVRTIPSKEGITIYEAFVEY